MVDASSRGLVTTVSDGAHGILAQSLGGGGGAGGFSGSVTAGTGSKPNVALSIGGGGGVAGNGSTVSLENDGAVQTTGNAAYGLFAQSVGGGGGDGGGSFSAALGSHDGGWNGSLAIGGSGDAGGNGGQVDTTNRSSIVTQGSKSHGIVAQSVGGGGGTGGFSASGVISRGTNTKDLSVSIGGSGGAGGHAAGVNVDNTGDISILGSSASGIVAQSLGGGGGDGGFSFAGSFAGTEAKELAIGIGGSGGAGGVGGQVVVHSSGVIDTPSGPVSDPIPPLPPDAVLAEERYPQTSCFGILAQSIGGGGGNGGSSLSIGTGFGGAKDTWNINASCSVGGSGGGGDVGGYVEVDNDGAVATKADDSHAILAQSLGGGGGEGAPVSRLRSVSGPSTKVVPSTQTSPSAVGEERATSAETSRSTTKARS